MGLPLPCLMRHTSCAASLLMGENTALASTQGGSSCRLPRHSPVNTAFTRHTNSKVPGYQAYGVQERQDAQGLLSGSFMYTMRHCHSWFKLALPVADNPCDRHGLSSDAKCWGCGFNRGHVHYHFDQGTGSCLGAVSLSCDIAFRSKLQHEQPGAFRQQPKWQRRCFGWFGLQQHTAWRA